MTTIPDALTALVQAARAGATNRVAAPAPQVEDGPWITRPDTPDVIVVGWTPDDGQAVALDDTISGLSSRHESYDVTCLASSWAGDSEDLADRRSRVDALIEAVRAELRADPTLGGVVTHARLSGVTLDQHQTTGGCEAVSVFTVRVDASRSTV